MFRFEYPIYLYCLAIPLLLVVLHYITNIVRKHRLKRFGDKYLIKELMPDVSLLRTELKFWLGIMALCLILVCLARPQYGTKIDTQKRNGIEAIIAVDVSNSMLAEDVTPSRLDKAKMLISNMVDNMAEDKIGLIVYAGEAFTQLPITSDYVSAKMFLDNINPSMVSVQGTDIASAIKLAMNSFTQQEHVGRAIFVITDGEDNEGGAIEAAKEARKKGMNVFMLGVGSPEGSPIPLSQGGYMTDNSGNTVVSKLNVDMCREIAQAGGGAYIYVDNSSSAQTALQNHINKLEKLEMEQTIYSEFDEHFMDFAWLALVLLILETMILPRKNRLFRNFKLFKIDSKKLSIFMLFLMIGASCVSVSAQNDRKLVRKGNRFYRDSTYTKAQIEYQKAIETNQDNAVARYNLGNVHSNQGQTEEALKHYEAASQLQKNKYRCAQIYHNMGVLYQKQKQFQQAIVCYKDALRRNPKDDETRYNLALCQYQLKKQQQNQDQNQDQNKNQDKDKQDQQQDQKKEEKKQEQSQDKNQPEQEQPKMSKDNAEQMLNAALRQEKDTQDKLQKAQQKPQRRQLEKQW